MRLAPLGHWRIQEHVSGQLMGKSCTGHRIMDTQAAACLAEGNTEATCAKQNLQDCKTSTGTPEPAVRKTAPNSKPLRGAPSGTLTERKRAAAAPEASGRPRPQEWRGVEVDADVNQCRVGLG